MLYNYCSDSTYLFLEIQLIYSLPLSLPEFNYTAWNSGSREFYPNYGAYNQQHGQQQQYAAQPTGGGYGEWYF